MEHTNTLYGKNAELLTLTLMLHTVTTRLLRMYGSRFV
jgi:hypothetical protein